MVAPLDHNILEKGSPVIIRNEPPVEVVGYKDAFLPTLDFETGEIRMRWWSIKRGLTLRAIGRERGLMIPLWQ